MKKFKQDLNELGKDILCGMKYIIKFIVLPVWWIKFVANERQCKNNKRQVLKPATQLVKILMVKSD